jgi:hypothetical protein
MLKTLDAELERCCRPPVWNCLEKKKSVCLKFGRESSCARGRRTCRERRANAAGFRNHAAVLDERVTPGTTFGRRTLRDAAAREC